MIKKVIFSIFIFLIYLPVSIIASYSSYLFLNSIINIYSLAWVSVIFLILLLAMLLFFMYMLVVIINKFSNKVASIKSKKKFMFFTVIIPVIFLCASAIILNYSVLYDKTIENSITSAKDIFAIGTSLNAISVVLIVFAICYVVALVLYEIANIIYLKVNKK